MLTLLLFVTLLLALLATRSVPELMEDAEAEQQEAAQKLSAPTGFLKSISSDSITIAADGSTIKAARTVYSNSAFLDEDQEDQENRDALQAGDAS